jgi:malonyl-CoA O-methyltransferase
LDKLKVASAFGHAASRYNHFAQVQQRILEWSLSHVPPLARANDSSLSASDPTCIVDLGCGTGRAIPALSKMAEKVIALDIAQPMLDVAAEQYSYINNIQYQCADFDQLSLHFQPHSIQCLFSSMSLQWSESPQTLIQSIAGVLSKSGSAHLTILIAPSFSRLKLAWKSIGRGHAVHDFASLPNWLAAIKQAGLSVEYAQETFIDFYPDFSSMLHSIKGVGAHTPDTVTGGHQSLQEQRVRLSKRQLKQARAAFLALNKGHFSLDYHVVQLHLRHRTSVRGF